MSGDGEFEEARRTPTPSLQMIVLFPVLLFVGLWVLFNDNGSALLVEAGAVMAAVGAAGTLVVLALTGALRFLRGLIKGDEGFEG